jgi:hypothetical protein
VPGVPRLAGAVEGAAPGRGWPARAGEADPGLADDAMALASDQPHVIELCEAIPLRLAPTVDAAPNATTGASSAPHTTRAPS